MNEIRIEKVTNGYIIRCFDGENYNSYDDTFVYPDFSSLIEFTALQFNENNFVSEFRDVLYAKEGSV